MTDTTLDADIAAIMAESADTNETEAPVETDADDVTDSSPEAPAEDQGEAEDSVEEVAPKVDTDALTKAIESDDPTAFITALGEHADKLLTGKAHKALRLQIKAVEDAGKKAEAAQAKADELATKLHNKYSDPIAARKAAESGDVDAFIGMVEKWGGRDWNSMLRWVTNGLAGRKERLEVKQRETSQADVMAQAKQEQAQAEVRAWIDGGIKALAPELHSPEVVEMVQQEIRDGFSSGITTPAKALPLVKKKLKAQYERLSKVFGQPSKPSRKTEAPAARAQRAVGTSSRETSLDEDIAAIKREAGLK